MKILLFLLLDPEFIWTNSFFSLILYGIENIIFNDFFISCFISTIISEFILFLENILNKIITIFKFSIEKYLPGVFFYTDIGSIKIVEGVLLLEFIAILIEYSYYLIIFIGESAASSTLFSISALLMFSAGIWLFTVFLGGIIGGFNDFSRFYPLYIVKIRSVAAVLFIIEVLSVFIRLVSLGLRLFSNIFSAILIDELVLGFIKGGIIFNLSPLTSVEIMFLSFLYNQVFSISENIGLFVQPIIFGILVMKYLVETAIIPRTR